VSVFFLICRHSSATCGAEDLRFFLLPLRLELGASNLQFILHQHHHLLLLSIGFFHSLVFTDVFWTCCHGIDVPWADDWRARAVLSSVQGCVLPDSGLRFELHPWFVIIDWTGCICLLFLPLAQYLLRQYLFKQPLFGSMFWWWLRLFSSLVLSQQLYYLASVLLFSFPVSNTHSTVRVFFCVCDVRPKPVRFLRRLEAGRFCLDLVFDKVTQLLSTFFADAVYCACHPDVAYVHYEYCLCSYSSCSGLNPVRSLRSNTDLAGFVISFISIVASINAGHVLGYGYGVSFRYFKTGSGELNKPLNQLLIFLNTGTDLQQVL